MLISAGFDAHRADPLGCCLLESSDFARMARPVRDLSQRTHAPVGVVLEGGYDPPALAESVIATMRALGGHDAAESIAPDLIYTRQAASYIGHHWELWSAGSSTDCHPWWDPGGRERAMPVAARGIPMAPVV